MPFPAPARGRTLAPPVALALALALATLPLGCSAPRAAAALPVAWPEGRQSSSFDGRQSPTFDGYRVPASSRGSWELGGTRLQGYLGVSELTDVTRKDDAGADAVTTDNDVTMPTVGGGGQWKLGGRRIDWGVEGLLSLSARGNVSAFATGSGGALVAVNIDLLVVDFFGGPFVSLWVTDRLRLYGGAGPLVVFTNYSQDADVEPFSRNGSGFGTGWYGRLGTELLIQGGTSIGIGARFSDTRVDLDSGLGDLDLEGLQYMFTVTTGW